MIVAARLGRGSVPPLTPSHCCPPPAVPLPTKKEVDSMLPGARSRGAGSRGGRGVFMSRESIAPSVPQQFPKAK